MYICKLPWPMSESRSCFHVNLFHSTFVGYKNNVFTNVTTSSFLPGVIVSTGVPVQEYLGRGRESPGNRSLKLALAIQATPLLASEYFEYRFFVPEKKTIISLQNYKNIFLEIKILH